MFTYRPSWDKAPANPEPVMVILWSTAGSRSVAGLTVRLGRTGCSGSGVGSGVGEGVGSGATGAAAYATGTKSSCAAFLTPPAA